MYQTAQQVKNLQTPVRPSQVGTLPMITPISSTQTGIDIGSIMSLMMPMMIVMMMMGMMGKMMASPAKAKQG